MLKVRLLHAAHLHELLHRAIARLPAGKVRATIHIALDDSLHFGCHLGTFWQWAFVMTLHVLSALPAALDDLEAFVTLLLHHLRMLVLSVVAVVAVVAMPSQAFMAMAIVVVPNARQAQKAQKAGKERHKRTAHHLHSFQCYPMDADLKSAAVTIPGISIMQKRQ